MIYQRIIQLLTLTTISLVYNANAQSPLRAGAAKVNVTPELGAVINGDFLPLYAKTIHDSLYAKALAFDNGKDRFVFVVVDCMAIDGSLMNEAKKLANQKTGLLPSQIMISSTHAHSCGAVTGNAVCPANFSYRLAMPERIAKSVTLAISNLQPAKIAWGHINVPQHVSCRRWYMKPGFKTVSPFGDTDKVWMNPPMGSPYLDKPVSETDPQVSYLAVKSMNNKWISIMANYSIHYAADIPEHTISADYFGEVHKQLQLKLKAEDGFVGIMTNGTSGDVNTFDFKLERNYPKEPYGKSKLIANDVSDSIIVSLKKAKFQDKPVFKFQYSFLSVGTRKPTDVQVEKSKQIVSQLDFETLNSIDKASAVFANMYAIQTLELNQYYKTTLYLPIQAIRIGEGTIGTLPGEIFSETGLWLKKNARSKYYFTVCLANSYVGYMPPAEQFKLGGYETWLCPTSHMEINAEGKLRSALLKLTKKVNSYSKK